jgi:inhibitor of cysteine peptidase
MATVTTEQPSTVTVAKEHVHPPIQVEAGKSFEIQLKENPTTGYSWALAQLPEHFYLLSDYYRPDQPVKPGSGGTHLFYFVAMKPKTEGNLIFLQLRPWEPAEPIAKEIFPVKVR